jgi:hypothetical protein
MEVERGLVYPR